MRATLTALLLFCLAAVPAAAQQAEAVGATPPAPSDAARQAIWCGAAFGITGQRLAAAGETEKAKSYADKASAAFGKAAAELIPAGMTVAQFKAMAETVASEITAPFRDTAFSEAECEAVAGP